MLFSNGNSKQNAFKKRKYPPGQHGRSSFRSLSEFGKQLQEKQKARFMFGITEKQFRKYYDKASTMEGVKGEQLMQLLERRLDNVVFRSGLATTRRQARQLVTHGHFELNGRRVDIPSIQVAIGDKIVIRTKSQKSPLFTEVKKAKDSSVKWVNADNGKLAIEVLALPDKDDTEQLINSQMIVEFYSK
jgi:small subunit ribosomal protein S4